jgi:hypothetical protein
MIALSDLLVASNAFKKKKSPRNHANYGVTRTLMIACLCEHPEPESELDTICRIPNAIFVRLNKS